MTASLSWYCLPNDFYGRNDVGSLSKHIDEFGDVVIIGSQVSEVT